MPIFSLCFMEKQGMIAVGRELEHQYNQALTMDMEIDVADIADCLTSVQGVLASREFLLRELPTTVAIAGLQ